MTESFPAHNPAVALFSGGLDSTTLIYKMLDEGLKPHCLFFDYGQRHIKEARVSKQLAGELDLQWDLIDLTSITALLAVSGSSLVNEDVDVPEGHYAEDNMRLTVVPNRNMMMLSVAAAIGIAEKAEVIGISVHAGDHAVYPDCRPAFVGAFNTALHIGMDGFKPPVVYAPFINRTKTDIAAVAMRLGVPIHRTWSCYKGGNFHCGRCGTCVERVEALRDAGYKLQSHQFEKGGLEYALDVLNSKAKGALSQ